MPTERQKKLAKEIIKNELDGKPKDRGEMLEAVGYAKNTAEAKPGEIMASQGVRQALEVVKEGMIEALKAKGVTPERISEVIAELMDAKKVKKVYIKGDLVTETEEIDAYAKDKGVTHALKIGVGGGYKAEAPPGPVINWWGNLQLQTIVANFEEQIKLALIAQNENPSSQLPPTLNPPAIIGEGECEREVLHAPSTFGGAKTAGRVFSVQGSEPKSDKASSSDQVRPLAHPTWAKKSLPAIVKAQGEVPELGVQEDVEPGEPNSEDRDDGERTIESDEPSS